MSTTFPGGKTAAEIEAGLPPLTETEQARYDGLVARGVIRPNDVFLPKSRLERCTGEHLKGIFDPTAVRETCRKLIELERGAA